MNEENQFKMLPNSHVKHPVCIAINQTNELSDELIKVYIQASTAHTEYTKILWGGVAFLGALLIALITFKQMSHPITLIIFLLFSILSLWLSKESMRAHNSMSRNLGQEWYKAKIIVGNFVRASATRQNDTWDYSVSYTVKGLEKNLFTHVSAQIYNDFVQHCKPGDEIYVLKYPVYRPDSVGFVAFCPYLFENTSSLKTPILGLSSQQIEEKESKRWKNDESDTW